MDLKEPTGEAEGGRVEVLELGIFLPGISVVINIEFMHEDNIFRHNVVTRHKSCMYLIYTNLICSKQGAHIYCCIH